MSDVLNMSVGLLGHVDCGKTSLAKAVSTTSSTACFDKNPQSQERGITIDLGFSSFSVSPVPENLSPFKVVQVTLVDCPGHASLIRTIIGGSQIINIALLVIDISKGIETQTAECLVVAEITCAKMIIVLNKIDLLAIENREAVIAKTIKRLKITLAGTKFKDAPIVSVSASPDNLSAAIGITELKQELIQSVELPSCSQPQGPLLMAVDHCFSIKGQGTIFTGSVLEGCVSVNDVIEIPALQVSRKVKSIQMFRQSVERACRGDRIGVCVTQVDAKLFERGLVTSEKNYLKPIYACIIDMNCIKYYKHNIKSKGKYHCSIGHDTVLAKVTIFQSEPKASTKSEDTMVRRLGDNVHKLDVSGDEIRPPKCSESGSNQPNVNSSNQSNVNTSNQSNVNSSNQSNVNTSNQSNVNTSHQPNVNASSQPNGKSSNDPNTKGSKKYGRRDEITRPFDLNDHFLFLDAISRDDNQEGSFALLEFDHPILAPPHCLIIGSKLDADIHTGSCRLAFHGRMQHAFLEKNYDLASLNVYKTKVKTGQLDRLVNPREIICKNLFGKNQLNSVEEMFVNFKVNLSSGESGFIETTFGKSGKVKVRLDREMAPSAGKDGGVTVEMKFRKYLFHKKKIGQD